MVFACVAFTSAAIAMTPEECSTLWKQSDVNGDGMLAGNEAERFDAILRLSGKPTETNGSITEATYRQSCVANVFDTIALDDEGPLEGANSFTEAQAIDRAIASGLSGVSGMTKDENGIWRGSGSKEGKTVSVSVDFKGNVVTN